MCPPEIMEIFRVYLNYAHYLILCVKFFIIRWFIEKLFNRLFYFIFSRNEPLHRKPTWREEGRSGAGWGGELQSTFGQEEAE